MFVAAQLAQSSVTSQQISQSSARLLEGARDPAVAAAIRKQQDAIQNLSDLYRQRSELAEVRPGQVAPRVDAADLASQIATAEQEQAEATRPCRPPRRGMASSCSRSLRCRRCWIRCGRTRRSSPSCLAIPKVGRLPCGPDASKWHTSTAARRAPRRWSSASAQQSSSPLPAHCRTSMPAPRRSFIRLCSAALPNRWKEPTA